MNNPIADQIVDTLTNLRREVLTNGITAEADAMWQHALSLYKMRQPPHRIGGDMPFGDNLPAFLRRQAE